MRGEPLKRRSHHAMPVEQGTKPREKCNLVAAGAGGESRGGFGGGGVVGVGKGGHGRWKEGWPRPRARRGARMAVWKRLRVMTLHIPPTNGLGNHLSKSGRVEWRSARSPPPMLLQSTVAAGTTAFAAAAFAAAESGGRCIFRYCCHCLYLHGRLYHTVAAAASAARAHAGRRRRPAAAPPPPPPRAATRETPPPPPLLRVSQTRQSQPFLPTLNLSCGVFPQSSAAVLVLIKKCP